MIQNRKQLREYLACDKQNYEIVAKPRSIRDRIIGRLLVSPISDQTKIWEYIKVLRKCEYYENVFWSNTFGDILRRFFLLYYLSRLRKLSRITGFQIPPNTIGRGLTIWHWGFIIINSKVKIGEYCTLQPGIVIGHKEEGGGTPQLGDHVTIGSGARIIGDIKIGNDVNIAPNAVVVHDVPSHCIVAGVPAHIIKSRNGINEPWKKV